MSDLAEIWCELEADRQTATGLLATRLRQSSTCGILAAIEKPSGRRALLLEVPAAAIPPDLRPPTAAGLELDVRPLSHGPSGEVRVVLLAKTARYNELFAAVADDVMRHLQTAVTGRDGVQVLVARLTQWERFFHHAGPEGLSEEAQRGLFAELWFIRRHLLERLSASQVIRSWTGPRGSSQDFQFADGAVEVKSSAAQPSARIHIANARQLDTTGLPSLYLAVIQIDVRVSPGETLPEMVASVRDRLSSSDPLDSERFDEILLELGYVDAQRALYTGHRYVVRQEILHDVRDGFPRIVEGDLRPGVGGVRYSIDLAACEPFRCSADHVDSLIQSELNVSSS